MSGPRPTTNEPAPSIPPVSTAHPSMSYSPTIDPAAAPSLTPRSLAARAEPKPTTLGGSAAHVIPTLPPDAKPRGKSGWLIAAGVAIAAAIAAFVVVKRMRADDGAHGTAPSTTADTAAPQPHTPATTPAPPPVAPPAAPTAVTFSFTLTPPDASITIDGTPIVLANGATQVPRDGKDHALVLSAAGYVTRTLTVKADHDRDLTLDLAPAPTPTPTPPTAAVTTPSHPPHIGHIRTPVRPVKPTGAGSGSAHDTKPTTSPNGSPIETTL
jgi:hypothetical protein